MEKEAFEPTGLIPRSIIRTVDRFVQQLLPGKEKIALQEYRVSRYQILVSIKSLLTLVLIPLLLSSTIKLLVFTPVVEHFWNSHQAEIFLNQYQEKRAFSEMHDFSEKMFFESLLIEPKVAPMVITAPYNIPLRVDLESPDVDFKSPDLLQSSCKSDAKRFSPEGYPARVKSSDQIQIGLYTVTESNPSSLRAPSQKNCFGLKKASSSFFTETVFCQRSCTRASLLRSKSVHTNTNQRFVSSFVSLANFCKAKVTRTNLLASASLLRSKSVQSFARRFALVKQSKSVQSFAYKSTCKCVTFAEQKCAELCKKICTCTRFALVKQSKSVQSKSDESLDGKPMRDVQAQNSQVQSLQLQNSHVQGIQSFALYALHVCEALQGEALHVCRALHVMQTPPQSFALSNPLAKFWINTSKEDLHNTQLQIRDTGKTPYSTAIDPFYSVTPLKLTFARAENYTFFPELSWSTLSLHTLEKDGEVQKNKSVQLQTQAPPQSSLYSRDAYQRAFQIKSLELAKSYNKQSILAITNLLGDFLTFFIVWVLFRLMRPELIILKSFLTESVYSLSDTTKSFLLILGMDLLVGFHSPRGWELALEGFLRHIGLPENENFILLFVALFPVFLDTVFKYWIFRYLNKISPSTVVTYHSMIE